LGNSKKYIFLFLLLLGLIGIAFFYPSKKEKTPNLLPVSSEVIKELAEKYKPSVVFEQSPPFYPVRFDELTKVALELDKTVIAELEISDALRATSNTLNNPKELFEEAPENSIIYYYSLSTIPENWQEEKAVKAFPDTLSLYVNATFDKYLKIIYTIPFEGNAWHNFHRGDGALFALYFDKKGASYQPIKARAYMHLQHTEVDYNENVVRTSQNESRPVFFVVSGSHSTYHRAGVYENIDGVPFMKKAEEAKSEYAYCADRIELVFEDTTRNKLEKWAFQGRVYWGGSPNDRILAKESMLKKIPLIRNLPLGNKSAKMSSDPSSVFDKKSYPESGISASEEEVLECSKE